MALIGIDLRQITYSDQGGPRMTKKAKKRKRQTEEREDLAQWEKLARCPNCQHKMCAGCVREASEWGYEDLPHLAIPRVLWKKRARCYECSAVAELIDWVDKNDDWPGSDFDPRVVGQERLVDRVNGINPPELTEEARVKAAQWSVSQIKLTKGKKKNA